MKSLIPLLRAVLADAGTMCGASTHRDWETVSARIKHEGISFVTITLPTFAKDFEEALDIGVVAATSFPGFRRRRGLPAFLQGFLRLVFDENSGVLLDAPSHAAIRAVRQITLVAGKINLECSNERTNAAFAAYIHCEREVRDADRRRSPDFLMDYGRVSRLLWADLLSRVDGNVYRGEVKPKHGPGSTADSLKGNAKFANRTWTERLEDSFPWISMGAASWSQYSELADVRWLTPEQEQPVKVISVPKTLKTPRIIAMEPSYVQYVQQGILERLVEAIDESPIARSLIGFVGTQELNQKLAQEGSRTGLLATLDLSEASDRVSNQLVRHLLSPHPWLFRAVDATRSRSADVPGHGVIRLAKFASMGSALTFPFEAMVFCTLVFMGIEREIGHHLRKSDVIRLLGKVRVYGDDIIVPTDYALSVIRTLEDQGLRVNRRKSFWTGKFRESCGKEYYDGYDVSVTRIREMLPSRRTDVSELVSTVSTRNQFWEQGYSNTVGVLDRVVKGLIPFPYIEPTSPALGRWGYRVTVGRHHPTLHRPEVRAMVVDAKLPVNRIDGYNALLKVFLKRGSHPFDDPMHLEVSGRPVAVRIKRQWAPVR